MSTARGTLYLIPVSLGETPWAQFLPNAAQNLTSGVRHFVVENAKTARAELKRLEHPGPIRDLSITELPEKPQAAQLDALLAPTLRGEDVGLMSEAGCPAVADPGALLVARAHERNIAVRPLVGPSSILLALMASGLNGQCFAFEGYLPVNDADRDAKIRRLEEGSRRERRTQIFIETPYRNERLFEALLATCRPTTRICIASDLTTPGEWIRTRTAQAWQQEPAPALNRRPTLFLLLAD